MVRCGFWTEFKKKKGITLKLRWDPRGYSVTGEWERSAFSYHIYTKKLKMGTMICLLHRPLVYDLWFLECPDALSRKRHISNCVNCALFAVSFKANYLLASFSPWSQVSLGKHSWYEALEFILWKCKSHCPPPVIIKVEGPLSRMKLLVWGR